MGEMVCSRDWNQDSVWEAVQVGHLLFSILSQVILRDK